MYHESEYLRLRARKAELLSTRVVHTGKRAKPVACTEAGGSLAAVGELFDSGAKAAAVLGVGAQRVNDSANTQKKRVRASDGQFYGFKYV
jgi:hypothetical protein